MRRRKAPLALPFSWAPAVLACLAGFLLGCERGAEPAGSTDVQRARPEAAAAAASDVAAAPAPERPLAAAATPRRGLWVLAEGSQRPLEDPARVTALLERATAIGATDLFVQVYRGGRSWFPSTHADDAPYRAIVERHGDTLADLIERAHADGLRVHAWFNVLRVAHNAEAPLLRAIGRKAVLVDRAGRSLLDYPRHDVPRPDRAHVRLGTPGIWLDPAVPEVVDYLAATLDDLIAAYPQFDGLHLDIIRHPIALPFAPGSRFDVGLDFGYGEVARQRFEQVHGSFARGSAWDDFRRAQVDATVARLTERVPDGWQRSAAVIPWADRAYLVAMQDWRRWLEQGWLDFAVAMAYTRDDALLRYQAHSLVGGVAGERVWLGLGSWLFARTPARITRQIEIAQAAAPAGIALFSWDSLEERPEAWAAVSWLGAATAPAVASEAPGATGTGP